MPRRRHPDEPIRSGTLQVPGRWRAADTRGAACLPGQDLPLPGRGCTDTPDGGRRLRTAAPTLGGMEEKDDVRSFAAKFMTDATSPPTPRPRRLLLRGRFDLVQILDVIVALVCFAITNSVLTNRTPPRRQLRRPPARAVCLPRLRAARAPNTVPAPRVGGLRAGRLRDQPVDPAGSLLGRTSRRLALRLRPAPVLGGRPLPPADRGRRDGRHRVRGRVHRPRVDAPAVFLIAVPSFSAPWSGCGAAASASSRSRSAGTPASARCSRSGSASPGSCTTWLPTTCR